MTVPDITQMANSLRKQLNGTDWAMASTFLARAEACAVILLVSAGDGLATGDPRNKAGAKIAPRHAGLELRSSSSMRLRELGILAQERGTALGSTWLNEVNPEASGRLDMNPFRELIPLYR
jgi:hypothetical protein